MDERLLERLIGRSSNAIRHPCALGLAFAGLVLSALAWVILRTMLSGIGGLFRVPALLLTASFSVLPLAVVIVPIATWYLQTRAGHTHIPLDETLRHRWRHAVALFLCGLGCATFELVLGIAVAIWCGLEAVPVFGPTLYLFFSWIPTVITLLMGLFLALSWIVLLYVGTALAQTPTAEDKEFWRQLPTTLPIEWLIRLKLVLLGALPSIIWFWASTTWTMKGLPVSVEFCASLFRLLIFSAIEAPLFLFLIHMTVEADRYASWLSSRRVG